MKKILLFVFALILFQNNPAAAEEAEAKAGQSPLSIAVDPRVELMSIIFRLAGNPEYNQGKVDSYTQDVEKQFGEFRGHPAVKLAQKLRQDHSVSYDACMSMAVHLTDTEKCDERAPFDPRPEKLDSRWSPEDAREFLAAVRQFVEDTHFNDFFNDHHSLYETTQTRMEELIYKNTHPEWFEEYLGYRPGANFNLVLALLNGGNSYGASCRIGDGGDEQYSILGVGKTDAEGLPVFDPSVLGFVGDEFCRSYVNPLTAKYKTEIDKYAKLIEPISNRIMMRRRPTWEKYVNDHIIRAIISRYRYLKVSKEDGESSLQEAKRAGLFYVPALCESLKKYENNRDKYTTFEDYIPELIKVFEDLSKQNLGKDFYFIPYKGTINAVISLNIDSVILIIPTREKDPEIQNNIHEFVHQYQRQFLPQAPIITDAEALKRNMKENSLIIFGTINGNLWLKKNAAKFPFKIEAAKITADKVYDGTELRFISALLNPQNPQRGILIYTAQQAKDIVKINSVFHGPTDYVVARESNVIKAGNYKKEKNKWSF